MTMTELREWGEYYQVEPFGQERDNLHAGLVASVIANAHRGKGTRAFSPSDFMLKDKAAEGAKSVLQFKALLKASSRKKT